jgi:hypothetical protein
MIWSFPGKWAWVYWTYAPVVFADNNTRATRCNEDCNIDRDFAKWQNFHRRNSIFLKGGEDCGQKRKGK